MVSDHESPSSYQQDDLIHSTIHLTNTWLPPSLTVGKFIFVFLLEFMSLPLSSYILFYGLYMWKYFNDHPIISLSVCVYLYITPMDTHIEALVFLLLFFISLAVKLQMLKFSGKNYYYNYWYMIKTTKLIWILIIIKHVKYNVIGIAPLEMEKV